jgi:hypothetical protein
MTVFGLGRKPRESIVEDTTKIDSRTATPSAEVVDWKVAAAQHLEGEQQVGGIRRTWAGMRSYVS